MPWSHYVLLIGKTRSHEARAFYRAEALRGGWSVRQLDRQITSQFYERTGLSRNKAAMLSTSNPGRITMADYIALDEANCILDEAVRAGKLAPAFRKELFFDVAQDPKKWQKIFASAVPFINVDKGTGIGGGETPLTASDEVEKRVAVLLSDDKQNKGPHLKGSAT